MARETSRSQLARRGLITLVALAVIGAFVTLRTNGTFGAQPHVTADVANAGGALRAGSDVKMNGVIVGKVREIRRADDGKGVTVEMAMSSDDLDSVPGNVVARILPATVFGTTFVDLVVHGAPTGRLRVGDRIKADATQETLELQQALDDIDRLVKALGPAELASAIGSAAEALDGRGNQIGTTVRQLNSYLDRLNPRMPQVGADLRALARTTRLVDEIAPDLLDATEDALVTMNTIVTQEAAITALISGGTTLARTSSRFLAKNQRDLVRFINGSAVLLDAVHDNRRAGITDALAVNIALGTTLPEAVEEGFVKTDGTIRLAPPPYYTSKPRFRTSEVGFGALGAER
ncbi:phospholipid/cholesterol/gamma-HCH transport system substrate-binding protein [Nocardioides sp. J9]|uniref:MCE family protein n=1 Tax=Nocardioides sp. J9 TaxID=935844 RepID=UPI0011A0AFBD|nr:MCE family protein [Nocardioides sp. J9]TWG97191.1 phospholipid/cholesterol/gamma-HCH transport system substrate-binding protein [Nocardioides sp. J9]